jgi:hypothetical protein
MHIINWWRMQQFTWWLNFVVFGRIGSCIESL